MKDEKIVSSKKLLTKLFRDSILKALAVYGGTAIKSNHFEVGSFVEDGNVKIYLENNHGYKTVLYANSLDSLIDSLTELKVSVKKLSEALSAIERDLK